MGYDGERGCIESIVDKSVELGPRFPDPMSIDIGTRWSRKVMGKEGSMLRMSGCGEDGRASCGIDLSSTCVAEDPASI